MLGFDQIVIALLLYAVCFVFCFFCGGCDSRAWREVAQISAVLTVLGLISAGV